MKKEEREQQGESYWKYLEENSKVVATWPNWLKGDRSSSNQEPKRNDEEKKLAS